LQEKLIYATLNKHLDLLQYFFTDHDTGQRTNKAIVYRMVTYLEYSVYEFGHKILRKGALPQGVIFIEKHGVTALGC
jgi:hypothetical protein